MDKAKKFEFSCMTLHNIYGTKAAYAAHITSVSCGLVPIKQALEMEVDTRSSAMFVSPKSVAERRLAKQTVSLVVKSDEGSRMLNQYRPQCIQLGTKDKYQSHNFLPLGVSMY